MKKDSLFIRIKKESPLVIISLLVGVFVFVALYGVDVLSFTNVDWLLNRGDLSQHYIGWKFYRNSVWIFPFGLMDNIAYPYKTSIIFTDSIPLFAVFFKILSPILPEHFQYFGLWGVISYAFQSLMGAYIIRRFTNSRLACVLGGLFFTLTPFMIYRMFGHTALASHWIILASILILLYYDYNKKHKEIVLIVWFCIGFITAGIHLYLFPVCWIVSFGYMIYQFVDSRDKLSFLNPVCFLAGVLLNIFFLGGFSTTAAINGGTLGECGLNLISLINPQGTSILLKDQPMYQMAWPNETYVYLGVGMLCFMLLTVPYIFRCFFDGRLHILLKGRKKEIITYSTIVIIMLFVSMGPVSAFRETLLYKIPVDGLVKTMWGVFQATARLSWIIVYLMITFAFYLNLKQWTTKITISLLIVCISLQAMDLSVFFKRIHVSFAGTQSYETQLASPDWTDIPNQIEHVYLSKSLIDNYDIADWASDNKLTLNNFYFARRIEGVDQAYSAAIQNPVEGELFLFLPGDEELNYAMSLDYFYKIDGIIVGSKCSLPVKTLEDTLDTINME